MIGTILVEGLEIDCVVGVFPHERTIVQRLIVDCELDRDLAPATATDDVRHTVDYVDLAAALTRLAEERRYKLLETFAEEAARLLLDRFGGSRAMVKVMKPGAVERARWPAVRVERRA